MSGGPQQIVDVSPATAARPESIRSPVLMRACDCGRAAPGPSGVCDECAAEARYGESAGVRLGEPDDVFEQEADRIAERITGDGISGEAVASEPVAASSAPGITVLQRQQVEEEGEEELLQAKPAGPRAAPARPAAVPAAASAVSSGGQPLGRTERAYFEPRFGRDLSHVRLHTDAAAGNAARGIAARAYTFGHHIAFASGQYAPSTVHGRRLLAHELVHTLQQGNDGKPNRIRRSLIFTSTMSICHRVLFSRKFQVRNGNVAVRANADWSTSPDPQCGRPTYPMTLTRIIDYWPDNEMGSCQFRTEGFDTVVWPDVPAGTYQLTIWPNNTNPNCCLRGDIQVFDETSVSGRRCDRQEDSGLEILHAALDAAGLIPGLGIVADAVNATVYVIEGDWLNAGISAAAMVPIFGDGATLVRQGVRVSRRAVMEVGEEGIERGLRRAQRGSGTASSATRRAEREVDRAWDATFNPRGPNTGEVYSGSQRLARGNLGERLAADALAHDGHRILDYKPNIAGTNQGGIDIVTMRDGFVYLVDNKALSRSGNISSVSALTTNLAQNRASVVRELTQAAQRQGISQAEEQVLREALRAIEAGNVRLAVTNANIARDTRITSGVTQRLRDQGIQFIDVF